jgi:hypothetical protein
MLCVVILKSSYKSDQNRIWDHCCRERKETRVRTAFGMSERDKHPNQVQEWIRRPELLHDKLLAESKDGD